MALNWNEIRTRAIDFSKEFENESSEKAEAKTFWDSFFTVFGINRRRFASFEHSVKKLGNEQGYIDLFWEGTLIAEHKSGGKSLDKAYDQAMGYLHGLKDEELPKYVIVSDFKNFRLYDLEDEEKFQQFHLSDFHKNIHLFDFILGYKKQKYEDEDPVNIEAAELMGELHDALKDSGYNGHELEVFLVRILFCLFADDTGIFNKGDFAFYIEKHTREDGSDLGPQLSYVFQVLNKDESKREKNLDEDLKLFPYVNGDLFKENLTFPAFNLNMRNTLLRCCKFDWSRISPAIFGSLFQSVMDKGLRKDLGAHYTSEKNIMKVIKNLFLDELKTEFEKVKVSKGSLDRFHLKLSKLKFFDPACGCGNFLIIAYRELRFLELEVIKALEHFRSKTIEFDVSHISQVDVDCMYGIEIEEFPARIAEVAMWLIDHQMNVLLSNEFGKHFARIPLKKSPHIKHDNSLQVHWKEFLPAEECHYILSNPPFISKSDRKKDQDSDMDLVFNNIENYKTLDYVCCWYIKAADYIYGTDIKTAFVSTNSISQGEQVGILWNILFPKGIKIHFAHRTFRWSNEARSNAQVYVIIIGFANFDTSTKYIYEYETPKSEPLEIKAKNINPYLVDYSDTIIFNRTRPLSNIPEIVFGSMPNDDGNFIFTDEEKKELLKEEPAAKKFIKPLISAREFLHNEKRWCLWLNNISPSEIKALPLVQERIKNVKNFRLSSKREATKKLALYPQLFGEIRQPDTDYIVIPRHSSENRKYIPIAILSKDMIASDSCLFVPKASLYLFGILTSLMHNAWMRQVCGRIKSDYRYSNKLVYNNFPFPDNPSKEKIARVEEEVKNVLSVREEYKNESLADLYNPLTMPKKLTDAHNKLDKAVDLCYRPQPFPNELSRLEFLFEMYKKYTAPLDFKEEKKKRKVKEAKKKINKEDVVYKTESTDEETEEMFKKGIIE